MSCSGDVMKPIEASSCCTPQDTAAHAARAMRTSGCGCAPVVEDTKHRKLLGVVTERDVCCGVAADDRRASEVRVDEIMRPSSACCGADEPVEEAGENSMSIARRACLWWTALEAAAAPSASTVWRIRKERRRVPRFIDRSDAPPSGAGPD